MSKRYLDAEDRMIRRLGEREERSRRGEREPLSWRDRDRLKDRSKHANLGPVGGGRSGSKAAFLEQRNRKANLAAADALFKKPDQQAKEEAILKARSTELDELIDDYLEAYGYPNSLEVLVRFTEHSSVSVVRNALKELQEKLPNLTDRQRDDMVQSLKLISMMGRDPSARRAVSGFLKRNKLAHVPI